MGSMGTKMIKLRKLNINLSFGRFSKSDYNYDPLTYRLTEIKTYAQNAETTPIQHLQYFYDAVGNIVKKRNLKEPGTFFGGTYTSSDSLFTYDPMYRLVESTGREHAGDVNTASADVYENYPFLSDYTSTPLAFRTYTEIYDYDKVGNILQLAHTAPSGAGMSTGTFTRHYHYESANNWLLDAALSATSATNYLYDANGNCTTMPGLSAMRWDPLDRLSSSSAQISGDIPETTYYQYDGQGNRVRKVTEHELSGSYTGPLPFTKKSERRYLGEFETYLKYVGNAVNLTRTTVHISDETGRFALIEDDETTVLTRYQHSDHLGSSCLETDGAGAVISYEEFHPFGTTAYSATLSSLSASAKRYKYCGKERDEESGLYYYGARYYCSWLGRFVSVDPLIDNYPQLTPYNYCNGDPIGDIDLDGRQSQKTEEIPLPSGFSTFSADWAYKSTGGDSSFFRNLNGISSNTTATPSGFQFNVSKTPNTRGFVNQDSITEITNGITPLNFSNVLLGNWKRGTGPENYYFPTNSKVSIEAGKSLIVQEMVNLWYDRNASNYADDKQFTSLRSTQGFGFGGLVNELGETKDLTNIQQFLGSSQVIINAGDNELNINIFNITSLSSGDGIGNLTGNVERSKSREIGGPNIPYSNISQTFSITLKIDFLKLENLKKQRDYEYETR